VTARLAAVAAVMLLMVGCSAESKPDPRASRPASARPAVDLAYAVRQWYQRAASIPEPRYFDPRSCGLKQPAKLWLLGGGGAKARRSCTVAAHRPILVPVINELIPGSAATAPPPPSSPMEVSLDGRPLTPTRIANRSPYRISAVRDNPIRLKGTEQVTDDGYWAFIDPGLTVGRHKLTIHTPNLPRPDVEWTLVAS
jgi:hypothetical protein